MRSLLAIGILLLSGCSGSADWTAFVYPDIKNIPNADKVQNYTIGNYRTFEECQTAAIDRVRSNYASSQRQGDYQCGYKCSRRDDFGGLLICKETRK
jgi:hypothetical protein